MTKDVKLPVNLILVLVIAGCASAPRPAFTEANAGPAPTIEVATEKVMDFYSQC